jgi:hypothetical protein
MKGNAVKVPKKPKPEDDEEFNFFDIDMDRLDFEWQRQARLFFKYATRLAAAESNVDAAKADMDLTVATLTARINDDPENEEFGLPAKPTVNAIRKCVEGHPEYTAARDAHNRAKRVAGVLDAAVKAMSHRKAALEGLTTLRMAHYYGGEAAPRGEAAREFTQSNSLKGAGLKKRDK